MQLYLIHAGFYDPHIGDGIFESHTNLFVAAESFEEARVRAKALPEFAARKMHIDGMVRVDQVQGFTVNLNSTIQPGLAAAETSVPCSQSAIQSEPQNRAQSPTPNTTPSPAAVAGETKLTPLRHRQLARS